MTEGPTDSVSLVRSDGLMLVRVPEVPADADPVLPRSPGGLLANIAARPEAGVFSARGVVDGVERMMSYRSVPDIPIIVAVGIRMDEALAVWRRQSILRIAVSIAVLALIAALTYTLIRNLAAARREFHEETGSVVEGEAMPLGAFRQPSGKIVEAWVVEGDFDPTTLKSNTFTLEWPPRSGRKREVPEVDRADWFTPEVAARKLLKGQRPILEALLRHLDMGQ